MLKFLRSIGKLQITIMTNTTAKPLTIIGIGASAGGLKALQAFVSGLNNNTKSCYLIAQHLSTNHQSNMVNLLTKYTDLPVYTAENGASLGADAIYVCPENANMTIQEQRIKITKPDESQSAAPSINALFESIADSFHEKSIAIVLSGVGSDGAEGVKSIVNNGGQVIVQDPQSVQYNGMVTATMNAVEVKHSASPQKIGALLTSINP